MCVYVCVCVCVCAYVWSQKKHYVLWIMDPRAFSGSIWGMILGTGVPSQQEFGSVKYTCIRTYIHTYIPTYLHTYIRTYIHTSTRTYRQLRILWSAPGPVHRCSPYCQRRMLWSVPGPELMPDRMPDTTPN